MKFNFFFPSVPSVPIGPRVLWRDIKLSTHPSSRGLIPRLDTKYIYSDSTSKDIGVGKLSKPSHEDDTSEIAGSPKTSKVGLIVYNVVASEYV